MGFRGRGGGVGRGGGGGGGVGGGGGRSAGGVSAETKEVYTNTLYI